jgi:uncharacterized RDD family membrane protein YckC
LSTWQADGHGQTGAQLPIGLRFAGAGVRVGAWLLDGAIFVLVSLIPVSFGVALGAVALNPQAVQQLENSPNLEPTVPLVVVNTGLLVAFVCLWVALAVTYSAVCWAFFRGLPGQRLLSLQVADAATGRNLPVWRAAVRALLVNGAQTGTLGVLIVVVLEFMARISPADYSEAGTNGSAYLADQAAWGVWSGLVSSCWIASWAWPLVLLITTGASRDRRGLHDRVAGSVVVARGIPPSQWAYPYGPDPNAPSGWPSPYGPGPGIAPGQAFGPGHGPVYPYVPQPVPGREVGVEQPRSVSAGESVPERESVPECEPADATETDRPAPVVWTGVLPPEPPVSAWDSVPPTSQSPARGRVWPKPDRPQVLGAKLPAGLRVASFNRRIGAYAIDSVILFVFYILVATAVGGTETSSGLAVPERQAMITGLICGAGQLVYFVAGWSIWRGSIGQNMVGLQVGDESTGGRLGWADAVVRWALLQGPFALVTATPYGVNSLIALAAVPWMFVLLFRAHDDPDGQGYHDRLVHSLVVQQV